MAARLVGAPEREITPERKGNRISEHNKAATPEKMTWEAGGVPTSQRGCLFPEYIFRGGRKSAIHITTGCRFVCSLPWQNRGHTSSLIAGGERKKSQKRGAGMGRGGELTLQFQLPLGVVPGHSGSVLEESHGSDGSHQFAMKTIRSPSLPPFKFLPLSLPFLCPQSIIT